MITGARSITEQDIKTLQRRIAVIHQQEFNCLGIKEFCIFFSDFKITSVT